MNYLEMSKNRYSVRKYIQKEVEQEKINKILEAIQNAPTAHNNQPQKIYVMKSKEALELVDTFTKGRFKAPLVFVICFDNTLSWKRQDGYDSGEVDCGIIGTHLMFEALEQGLGSCWVAMFNKDVLREKLNLSENIIPIAIMPVGYADPGFEPFAYHFQRKDLIETVEYK